MTPDLESNIPMPRPQTKWTPIVQSMKKGDSFLVERSEQRMCALKCGLRLGIRLASRKINNGGFRVWRVK